MFPTANLDPEYAKAAMAPEPTWADVRAGEVEVRLPHYPDGTEAGGGRGSRSRRSKTPSFSCSNSRNKARQRQAYAAQLADEAKKTGIDKTAAAHGLHAVTTDYVAKDGVIGGLSDSAAMLSQAFTADKGAAPATVSTGDGYAVFQVVDVKPAHAPDFATFKSHILDDYREQKVPELVQQETQKLADRAHALSDLKKAAAELKVPVKSSDLVGQDGQVPDLGAMSGPASVAFALAKGGISGPLQTEQAGAVLNVTDKQEPTADDMAKNFDQMREQLLNDQREQVFQVFAETLAKQYEDGGGVRLTKKAAAPGSTPSGPVVDSYE